jgi:hypothetical protein
LITNTLHVLQVFTTPIATLKKTPNRHKIFIGPIGLKILSQVEHVEEPSVEPIKEAITN